MKARGRFGRVLLFVSRCVDTTIKPEARVFEMASQSAPNCKQKKKRKQKNKRKKKITSNPKNPVTFNAEREEDDSVFPNEC